VTVIELKEDDVLAEQQPATANDDARGKRASEGCDD
jgi:hypothetical protein